MNIASKLRVFNKPLTMGILNLTPDSFYEGSRVMDEEAILAKAEIMVADGADILDLGAYSTRPGADDVSKELEMDRLTKGIRAVRDRFQDLIISADTFRSDVAGAAVKAGADMINDVGSGILDPHMFETMAELNVPYILMHNRGYPKEMTRLTDYGDVVDEVVFELSEKLNTLRRLGAKDVIIDPGFGFSKTVEQNFEMMRRLEEFSVLECPLLVGISRKSMIWRTLRTDADSALNGTTVLNTLALQKGANIFRVHDVRECREAILLHGSVTGR